MQKKIRALYRWDKSKTGRLKLRIMEYKSVYLGSKARISATNLETQNLAAK